MAHLSNATEGHPLPNPFASRLSKLPFLLLIEIDYEAGTNLSRGGTHGEQ